MSFFDSRILILVVLILLFGFIRKKKEREKESGKDRSKKKDPFPDLNKKFFEEAAGREAIPFIRAYNSGDVAIIRSLFDANGINSMIYFDSMSSLYPNLRFPGYSDTTIYIYSNQTEEARELAEEYIDDLRKRNKQTTGQSIGNIAEIALGVISIPSGRNRIIPEILNKPDQPLK